MQILVVKTKSVYTAYYKGQQYSGITREEAIRKITNPKKVKGTRKRRVPLLD